LEISPLLAVTVGLFSALHCLGMCGSIISALTLSLPAEVRNDRQRTVLYLGAYNLGRLLSYALAGALIGRLGNTLLGSITLAEGHALLRYLGAATMAGIGLYLAGWFPKFALVERIGLPLWRRLEPLGRRLTPVRSLPQALLFGVIWGWLPCGLVYSSLIWAASTGSAAQGAYLMLAFGLGTLPTALSAGILMAWLVRLARVPYLRQAVGVALLLLAVVSLL
jgi:sulfite exporter TauE/SafE